MRPGRWKTVRKIDAHVHVVLHERENTDLVLNSTQSMLRTMDKQGVDRAIVVPINFPEYFPNGSQASDGNWVASNNVRQSSIAAEADGRLDAFADCGIQETMQGRDSVTHAIRTLGLSGLKIHPYNLGASADDLRLHEWIAAAADLCVPIIFHSNPSGHSADFHGSAPARIYQAVYGLDAVYSIAHMGGVAFQELLAGGGYVDLSGTLLWLADLYGSKFCERFLRRIGIARLLFATDYPIFAYEDYFAVLDQMAFSDEEVSMIASQNAERFLKCLPPLVHS